MYGPWKHLSFTLQNALAPLLFTFRASVSRQVLAGECILLGQLMFSLEEWFLPLGDVGMPLHNALSKQQLFKAII